MDLKMAMSRLTSAVVSVVLIQKVAILKQVENIGFFSHPFMSP